jgi:DNA-binding PadR family transcriptional regulator
MSSSVSKMKNLGFLEAERQGKEIYYSINEEGIDQIALLMNKINQIK